jgi:4-hydroxy-tetrahydrodipicolinate reductase
VSTRVIIALVGASGKMGQAVSRLAGEHGIVVNCAISEGDSFEALTKMRPSVAVDFSLPAATTALAAAASSVGTAIVSGTTGLDDAAYRALDDASKKVPVLWEPNMSMGIAVVGELVRRAIAMLGPSFDVEIVEAHHRQKADAPSGTALRLAEIAKAAREPFGAPSDFVHGRHGKPGPRGEREIGVHAVRGGDVVGDHAVYLFGAGERVEIVHRASSRDLFAHGALRAARWIAGRQPGRYTLAQVLADRTFAE